MELTVLGAFRARLGGPGQREAQIQGRKARALLAFLALPPGRIHERDKLAALLWGDTPDAEARHSLRQALSVLRRALPGVLLAGESVGLVLDGIDVDAVEFQRLATAGDTPSLEAAARLYGGDLLDGFHVESEPFSDWLRAERERLRELAVETLARLLAGHERAGATADGIRVALQLIELDPLQEAVHRTIMRLYARQGRRAAALNHYQGLVELLRREMGAEPETESRQTYQALLRQAPGSFPARQIVVPREDDGDGGHGIDPPLVGRDGELLQLAALAGSVRAGHGRTVVLVAEAGGGKTRMLAELASSWLESGGQVLLGRCREIQRTVPLGVWADALAGGPAPADLDRLLGSGSLVRKELTRLLPDPGAPPPDGVIRGGQRVALLDAVVELVTRLASEQPLMVALDDLQWADDASLELLVHMSRRIARAPVLLAVTARDEEMVDAPRLEAALRALSSEQRLDHLALTPLSHRLVDRLVRTLAEASLPPARLERLAAHAWKISEGNPFLAVEATRDVGHAATQPARGAAVPDRARALVASRLSRVSRAARRMADLAAVIGREFEFAVIARAAGLKARDAAELVDELVRRRVFRSLGQHLEFTHDLLRETIVGELPEGSEARLHRAVAAALTARGVERTPTASKRIARHYGRAGMTAKAVEWLVRYADQSIRVFAPDEAALALEQAVAHTEGRAALRGRRRLDLLLQLASALAIANRFPEILVRLLPEEPLVERLADPALAARYFFRVVLTQVVLEDEHRRAEMSRRGLEAAGLSGDAGALGCLLYAIAGGCVADGHPRAGLAHAERAVELLERAGEREWLALALWVLGVHRLVLGELDAALEAESRSVAQAALLKQPGLESFGATIIAWIHIERGDLPAARAQCQTVLGAPGEAVNTLTAVGLTGIAHLEAGEPEQAIPLLEEAVERMAAPTRREVFAIPLGEAHAAVGNLERARGLAARALETAERSSSGWKQGRARRLAGLLAGLEGRATEAERLLGQAVADLMAVPAPLEVARTRLVVARLAAARGDHAASQEALGLARVSYTSLRLPLQVERVERLEQELTRDRPSPPERDGSLAARPAPR